MLVASVAHALRSMSSVNAGPSSKQPADVVMGRENSPRSVHTPKMRRPSASNGAGSSTPLRRVSSATGQPSGRVVGLGLLDGTAVELSDGPQDLWVDGSPSEDSRTPLTAPMTPNRLSPQLLFSPEAGASSSVVTLVATDAAIRSPRSSALLDPGMAGQPGRRSSISHASHSSSGSASSFHSALSIRMDEPASTATSRNPSSNYWLPSPSEKSSPEDKYLELPPRVEKRYVTRRLMQKWECRLMYLVQSAAWRAIAKPALWPIQWAGVHCYAWRDRCQWAAQKVFTNASFDPGLCRLFAPLPHFATIDAIYAIFSAERLAGRGIQRRSVAKDCVWKAGDEINVGRTESIISMAPSLQIQQDAQQIAERHPRECHAVSLSATSFRGQKVDPFPHSYIYRGSSMEGQGEVTACVYTNEAWLSELPEFARRWNGPISAVFETMHARGTPGFEAAIASVAALRDREPIIKQWTDFHFVVSSPSSEPQHRRIRTRMINAPVASNFQLNTARFFSRTPAVWLVGDARVLPSPGLRKRLNNDTLLTRVNKHADAVVVPMFAAFRRDEDRRRLSAPALRLLEGQSISSSDNFASLARRTIDAHRNSLSMPLDRWPRKKSALVSMTSLNPSPSAVVDGSATPSGPLFALFDRSWDANKGPSNFALWRRPAGDARLLEGPNVGGGAGLGLDGQIGGGNELFRVTDYDLHYEPAVVIGRTQQPWCTERFGASRAACIYQMYLAGAEMWVVPDEWAFTLEPIERNGTSVHGLDKSVADAERLQVRFLPTLAVTIDSIDTRTLSHLASILNIIKRLACTMAANSSR